MHTPLKVEPLSLEECASLQEAWTKPGSGFSPVKDVVLRLLATVEMQVKARKEFEDIAYDKCVERDRCVKALRDALQMLQWQDPGRASEILEDALA